MLLEISNTLYSIVPACVSTNTCSPTAFPSNAAPSGDSFEILPAKLFASVEPTMLYSTSSSNSSSYNNTVHPMLILFKSTSFSSTISTSFKIFSISSIRASISRYSSFDSASHWNCKIHSKTEKTKKYCEKTETLITKKIAAVILTNHNSDFSILHLTPSQPFLLPLQDSPVTAPFPPYSAVLHTPAATSAPFHSFSHTLAALVNFSAVPVDSPVPLTPSSVH